MKTQSDLEDRLTQKHYDEYKAESTDAKLARIIKYATESVAHDLPDCPCGACSSRREKLSLLLLVQAMGKALKELLHHGTVIGDEVFQADPQKAVSALLALDETIKELK